MSLVDLRFSDVEPPGQEPQRRIYCDIVNLPDPLTMALGVRVFNLDSSALYMKVDATGGAWTFTPAELGSLAAGSDFYRNLTSFGERARPGSPTQELLVVTLYAYSDAGYANLVWTRARNLIVEYIKSDDGTWVTDFVNNFDEGTKQGWDAKPIPCGTGAGISVVTDYVLSPPNALRWYCNHSTSSATHDAYFYKSFTTPNRNRVVMIADFRIDHNVASDRGIYAEVDGVRTLVCQLDAPQDTWMRLVVPLPIDSTGVEIRIGQTYWNGMSDPAKMWLDDFKIISKDIDAPILDLSDTEGIAFYWWGSGGLDQQIDFEVESPTGSWVGKFYDGPALWRWVFLRWSDLTAVDLDGSRPDRSNVTGIFWTYHTDGVRRINYIVGWRKQDVYCHAIIRQPTSVDLYAHVVIQDTAELYGHGVIRNVASVDLPATVEVRQDSADLFAKFVVAQYFADADLPAKVVVAQFQVSIREHKVYAAWNPAWSYTKPSASILRGTSPGFGLLGASYFFFVVSREWIHDKYLRITWKGDYTIGTWGTNVTIYDGAYDRSSDVDFPSGSGILIKGNGLLQTLLTHLGDFGSLTEEGQIDTSGGVEPLVTVFIKSQDSWDGQSGYYEVDMVEINSGPGGVGTLYHEPFKAAINMERTGTTGDYGYISEGELPQAAGSRELFAKFVVNP